MKAKTWAALIGFIAAIAGIVWFLIKHPEIWQKIWEFIKGIGVKLWNMWINFWNGMGPKAKLIVVAIASIIGLICFGPWGLLVGAILFIVSMWPKYKALIIAFGIAIAAVMVGFWLMSIFGPYALLVGIVVAVVALIVGLIIQFKDKIWGWIKSIASFVWNIVKVILKILGLAILAILLGPIGIILATWLAIKMFFPNLAKKIKNAVYGLLSKIPFVGRFFKGKSDEDSDGDDTKEKTIEAAENQNKDKEKIEEKAKPEEKSSGILGGMFGGGGGAPKMEAASPSTSYSQTSISNSSNSSSSVGGESINPTAIRPLVNDAIEKIIDAIEDLSNENSNAANRIIAAMRMGGGNARLTRTASRIYFAVGRIYTAIEWVLTAVKNIGLQIARKVSSVRGMSVISDALKFSMNIISNAVNPIKTILGQMNEQLKIISAKVGTSSIFGGITGIFNHGISLISNGVSKLSETAVVQNIFSKIKGIFNKDSSNSQTNTENDTTSIKTETNSNVTSSNKITTAENQKEIPSNYTKVMLDGLIIDKKKYDDAVKKYGKEAVDAKPWLVNVDFDNSDEMRQEANDWNLSKELVRRKGYTEDELASLSKGEVYKIKKEAEAKQVTPKSPNKIENIDISANAVPEIGKLTTAQENMQQTQEETERRKAETVKLSAQEESDKINGIIKMLPAVIAYGMQVFFKDNKILLGFDQGENSLAVKNDKAGKQK